MKASTLKKKKRLRKLHIGGVTPRAGWEILNAVPGPNVTHICNAKDLSAFPDSTFAEVYASHVLEHFDYQEIVQVLAEWHRVLAPRGKIYISVPDLDTLCRLFLSQEFDVLNRLQIMVYMFGAHVDEYDRHSAGLNFDILNYYMEQVGFTHIKKVSTFDIDFNDTSSMKFAGQPISLNIVARKGPGNRS